MWTGPPCLPVGHVPERADQLEDLDAETRCIGVRGVRAQGEVEQWDGGIPLNFEPAGP